MITRERLTLILSDVRFWIGLFVCLHLTSITLPPLEGGSTWRQTDGYMIARNYYERNANFFYPTVDVGGIRPGIVGCEFPIINYLVYLLSVVFGEFHSWFGRLINLAVSSTGVYFLYRLIRDYVGKQAALNTTIIVLGSIWFTYSRTNIPDTFGASLCIISLYFGTRYLLQQRTPDLFIFILAGMIGCLTRVSAAVILTLIAIPFLFGTSALRPRIFVTLGATLILGAVFAWYFVWAPYLNTVFEFSDHFFRGLSFSDGIEWLYYRPLLVLKRFYETPMKYIAFVVFVCSLVYVVNKKNWFVFSIFSIPFLVYSIMILRLATGLTDDAYYTILFMLPMAFVAGWGLAQLNNKKLMIVMLLAIGIEGVANQIHVFQIRQPYKSLEDLEAIMDSVSRRTDLIAITGVLDQDPTPMYMAHRRGWVFPIETFANTELLQQLKVQGCVYIVIVKKLCGDTDLKIPKVYDSDSFAVYRLADVNSSTLMNL